MTNDQEVIQYDNEVSSLIDTYNKQIELAKSSSNSSDIAFFDMGKKLIDIEKKIENDNQENKIKSKKIFAAFKIRISEKIKRNISNIDKVVKVGAVTEFGKNSTLSFYGKSLRVVMAINALSGQNHVLEPSAAKHSLRDRSRVVPRSDSACVFTERLLRSENAGFPTSRRVIARIMLDIPLLGIQQMKQDGWGSRRHERSRDFCRLLGRDAHKSFRKNSDSPLLICLAAKGQSALL